MVSNVVAEDNQIASESVETNKYCEHMQILCFKFNQNCTLNDEFDFSEVKGAEGGRGASISKIRKKPHEKRWSKLAPKISAF